MSICYSGVKNKVFGGNISVKIENVHPLIRLANFVPWEKIADLVLPDLQATTKNKKWWLGRKLKLRVHLGVYFLQQMFNKTDRQIEYDVKDNAAYQLFCGKNIVDNWHAPDHTKVEEFRSRLSPETQRSIGNLFAKCAVDAGFANPANIDIDSTIQEANMTYPTQAKLLVKLAVLSKKISKHMEKYVNDFQYSYKIGGFSVDLKKIKGVFKDLVFSSRKTTESEKRGKIKELFKVVAPVVCAANAVCKKLLAKNKKMPWNIKRTAKQIVDVGMHYFDTLGKNLYLETDHRLKLSLHLNKIACFNKGKLHKKYEFGRSYQLIRLEGNIMIAAESKDVRMDDKSSIGQIIAEHQRLFGKNTLHSATADKGYYSSKNEELFQQADVKEIGIIRPSKVKKEPLHDDETTEKLYNRRSGIEPLIGHVKHGGQLGRSRMKSDRTTLSSGYSSVLGFNLRQIVHYQRKMDEKVA